MNSFTTHFYETQDGQKIHYKTNFNLNDYDPKKTLLVFNYGLVCSELHWSKQIPFFEKLGFDILLHDYRGHFLSSTDELKDCSFEQFSHDLFSLLEGLTHKKIFMIGHSMGVNVTLEYAKDHHKKLAGIVLISGSVFPPQNVMFHSNVMEYCMPFIKLFRHKAPEAFNVIWTKGRHLPITQLFIQRGGFNPARTPISFVKEYLERISRLEPDLFFTLFSEMGKHDILPYLPKISCPALVMGGDQDKIIPNYIQEIIADAIPSSELYIIHKGSHVPQVDFPETVNERIQLFLES